MQRRITAEVEISKKVFPDGKIYEGHMKNGQPHGYGIMLYENNIKRITPAEGAEIPEIRDFDGYTMIFSYFVRYDGGWRNGKRHGYGKLVFTNGIVYDGLFEDDETAQYGRMELEGGDVYTGGWNEWRPHGFGAYSYSDGSSYIGEFRKGFRHGKGTYTFADGSVYEGEWRENQFFGEGTLIESGVKRTVTWGTHHNSYRINENKGRKVLNPRGFMGSLNRRGFPCDSKGVKFV